MKPAADRCSASQDLHLKYTHITGLLGGNERPPGDFTYSGIKNILNNSACVRTIGDVSCSIIPLRLANANSRSTCRAPERCNESSDL